MKKRVTQVSISVIGAGRLGGALTKAIAKSEAYSLHSHLPARSRSFGKLGTDGGAEVLFIVCKDKEIKSVAEKAVDLCGENLKIIVHCAGSLSPDILPKVKGVSRLLLHPIQSIAEPDAKLLKHISWMACTNSASALLFAKHFTTSLECEELLTLKISQLPLYHTLTVFASNFTTLLGGAVEVMGKDLKIDKKTLKKALTPLMRRSLENVLAGDAKKVLTGPIARKDFATILKHRIALKSQPLALRKIYEGFLMLAQEL